MSNPSPVQPRQRVCALLGSPSPAAAAVVPRIAALLQPAPRHPA